MRRSRSFSRSSAASMEADLSSSGFAAVVTVIPWAAEQVGAQAQRIEACDAELLVEAVIAGPMHDHQDREEPDHNRLRLGRRAPRQAPEAAARVCR